MPKRVYFYSTLLVLFFSISTSLTAYGEDETDAVRQAFDHVLSSPAPREDHNGKRREKDGTATQGTVCITCSIATTENSNQADLRAIGKMARRSRPKKTPECIGCGRITVQKKGKIDIQPHPKDLWAEYPEIYAYSLSARTDKMIDAALEDSYWVLDKFSRRRLRRRPPVPSTGNCLRHVKCALQKSYLKPEYLGGGRVNRPPGDAIKRLKKVGFVNLLETPPYDKLIADPARAPKGSVLIYAGGSNGGHIEIKTDWGTMGTYVSDHQADNSIMQNALNGRAGRSYKLIGVMVKPGG